MPLYIPESKIHSDIPLKVLHFRKDFLPFKCYNSIWSAALLRFAFLQYSLIPPIALAIVKEAFRFTLKSLRFLLFKYAEDNNIRHQFPVDSKLAGRDFTRGFMRRNRLSLRVPRKTSVARAMGFNRLQLLQYFDNLGAALRSTSLAPTKSTIWMKLGCKLAQTNSLLHVAPTGKKEVAKTVAAEQGQTVTAVCAMNAVGNYIPPYFIYARKEKKIANCFVVAQLGSYYDAAVDAWDVSNPGQTFDIYSVAATFKVALRKLEPLQLQFKVSKQQAYLRSTHIFVEADFLPSEVLIKAPGTRFHQCYR
ncbi:hypothetical protein NQ318_012091 [Aromia moschata]|uniref:Ig-like domain-containing protein n=1 Tax=Aromia moschata TaxID=1265417 RepID=A0AAV8X8G2_9CUCU|nr:hypothetical protein NQ318_012091 [Aromia moschata]